MIVFILFSNYLNTHNLTQITIPYIVINNRLMRELVSYALHIKWIIRFEYTIKDR